MLTDRLIATIKADGQRLDLPDDLVPGLALRVTPSGVKTWSLRYRMEGGRRARVRRLTLGTYPTVKLADARKKAQAARRKVDGGTDPAAEKQLAREGDTIADLAKDYIAKYAKVHKRSWKDDQRYLDAEVLPAWKHIKVQQLTRRDVRSLIEGIAERGSPISANRCLALVRKMLNWAVAHDWLDANPAALIPKPGVERSRDRVLTDEEIRAVWASMARERAAMGALMKLRLVLAQRAVELARVKWTDIEGDVLTFRVTKNKQPMRLPLTKTAVEILNTLPQIEDCEYVFPGRGGKRPLSDMKHAARRIGERALETLQKADRTITAFDFHGRDLRRTAATKMREAGVPRADISRVLNHVEGGPRATQVYDRYEGEREKRLALQAWERVLTGILTGKGGGNVLPFGKRARGRARRERATA
jgi:integrase